jgi:hypothetical protein
MALSFSRDSGLREHWTFDYTVASLLEGVKRQLAFRQQRKAFWEDVYATVKKKLETEGIKVTESGANGASLQGNYDKMSYVGTRTMGPSVQIDTGLQNQLAEANSKINHHDGMIGEYTAWLEVLEAAVALNPGQTRTLNMEDWLYFFRKK